MIELGNLFFLFFAITNELKDICNEQYVFFNENTQSANDVCSPGRGGILKAPDLNLTKAGDLTHKL